MKIKTYRSESVPKALEQIKKELGPHAVILETKRTKRRKLLGLASALAYEITAASEVSGDRGSTHDSKPPRARRVESYEAAPAPAPKPAGVRPKTPPKKPQPLRAATAGTGSQRGADNLAPQVQQLSNEIGELKRLIAYRTPLSSPALLYFRNDILYEEFQHLISQGVDENLAFSLMRVAARRLQPGNDSRRQLRSRLNQTVVRMVRTAPIEKSTSAPKAAIFLGPTGVGKTTTLAKLAAVFALGEQQRVRLITLDTYRIAAAEQLKVYGEIIGVPVHVTASVSGLIDAIGKCRDADRILVDTTGLGPRRVSDCEELASFLRNTDQLEKHLVLSMTTKSEDLRETIRSFEAFRPDKLVFTKLDETSSLGPVLNEVIRTGKPVAYMTNGQNVPEDLVVPTAQVVADLLVPLN